MGKKQIAKETVCYLVVGGMTTVVNWAVYLLATRIFSVEEWIANMVAWVVAVAFAYVANRNWVFLSKSKTVLKEACSFVLSRLTSGVLEQLLFMLFVEVWLINDLVTKVVLAVLVIVMNYLTGKFWVFGKKKNPPTAP